MYGAGGYSSNDYDLSVSVFPVFVLPDLVISEIAVDEMGFLSYVIANQSPGVVIGYQDVVNSVEITYPDGTVVELESSVGLVESDFAEPYGESTVDSATLMDAGTYSVTVCADSSEAVLEESEDNNCMTSEFEFAGYESSLPDLSITQVELDDMGSLSYRLDNLDAGYVSDYESVVDSIFITYPDGSLLEVTSTPGLIVSPAFAEGYGYLVMEDVATVIDAGTYSFEVCTDAFGSILESNEDNNCMTSEFEFAGYETEESTDDSGSSSSSSSSSSDAPVYGGGAASSGGGSRYSDSSSSDSEEDVVYGGGAAGEEVVGDEVILSSEEEVCGELPFLDVDGEAPYFDSIYDAWCNGIVHGRTSTSFAPEDLILRGEVAKVVAGVFGYAPIDGLTEVSYVDIDSFEPLAPYIEALTEVGILEGYTDTGMFRPHQAITIDEIKALMRRLVGEDVDLSEYSEDGVHVTRGMFMDFILRYL